MFKDLILKNRSYRRFHETAALERGQLEKLIELARLTPSAANKQPLKYLLACDPAINAKIFPCLSWAGYLKEWGGPAAGERPSAYIIILLDTEISDNAGCDHGIAAQTIMLGAVEAGLGGCILGSIRREQLQSALEIPERYKILLVLALGQPVEEVVLEQAGPGSAADIKYWRDQREVHHVPKRGLSDVLLN
jgi:nitroreductase